MSSRPVRIRGRAFKEPSPASIGVGVAILVFIIVVITWLAGAMTTAAN